MWVEADNQLNHHQCNMGITMGTAGKVQAMQKLDMMYL